ncbi:MAG: hypothetical protein LQ349_002946 [Xanthoria aureola]|nr:MAG: hypothetical protein LQ349_002946 [Xanthoria aureola]
MISCAISSLTTLLVVAALFTFPNEQIEPPNTMDGCRVFRLILSLLGLTVCTLQVDITITATGSNLAGNAIAVVPNALPRSNPRSVVIATCPDIPPGQCCHAPQHLHMLGSSINFSNLQITDIAAVWAARTIMDHYTTQAVVRGCSGTVTASEPGPGDWSWRATADVLKEWQSRAVGASYITLPATLPPNASTSKWLMAEGLLGLVWGGGKWFASPAAQSLLGPRGSLTKKRTIAPRGIRWASKGNVYALPPLRGRFPTRIQVDGTEYSHSGTFIYADGAGNKVNLTNWFIP